MEDGEDKEKEGGSEVGGESEAGKEEGSEAGRRNEERVGPLNEAEE